MHIQLSYFMMTIAVNNVGRKRKNIKEHALKVHLLTDSFVVGWKSFCPGVRGLEGKVLEALGDAWFLP